MSLTNVKNNKVRTIRIGDRIRYKLEGQEIHLGKIKKIATDSISTDKETFAVKDLVLLGKGRSAGREVIGGVFKLFAVSILFVALLQITETPVGVYFIAVGLYYLGDRMETILWDVKTDWKLMVVN